MPTGNSFGSLSTLSVGGKPYSVHKLSAVEAVHPQAKKLPYSLKILLENLLRNEGVGLAVRKADIDALALWQPKAEPNVEIAFTPARVLMQDFTGVPCVVDLAAMRDAMKALGGDPTKINPLVPVELVIDHSVQVDEYGTSKAFADNVALEYERNQERYTFLRWGAKAFNDFKVVPPGTGICHQVNLEFLARGVFDDPQGNAYPDTLVGTDSHTTMINGLGVLGWGVGGIEAEAAMLGQPVSMLIPQVIGFKLSGKLAPGATATDLVLTVTQMLRKKGVVGKFVEFFGPGLAELPLADRATIANMAPEYGATCGIFPVDAETIRYLTDTGRPAERIALVEAYCKEQGLFHDANTPEAVYTDTLELNLAEVVPSMAGPTRPQDRVALADIKQSFADALPKLKTPAKGRPLAGAPLPVVAAGGPSHEALGGGPGGVFGAKTSHEVPKGALHDGSVVIAAITSCTNTSNPSVMVAAGVLAKKAVARGLSTKPWVKTSLAPGSQVVTDYLETSGLIEDLNKLRFNVVGYGCTTCIAAGTPVLLANGTARTIESFPSAGGAVLFAPTADGRLTAAVQTELHAKGERECVTLILQDGRELVCTPDHEILRADGRWVRADELVPGTDRVVVGPDAPADVIGADEAGYVLRAGEMTFTMADPHERLRTLAFARLLGHLLGDGSISTHGQGRMNVGQAVDRESALNDIEVLTGKRPAGTRYDERKWSIALPAELTAAIVALPGVRVGRRIDQPPRLPEFVLDESCPVAVVREFLGGVFGADGTAPVLKRLGEREETAILEQPAYSQTARPEHVGDLKQVMARLCALLVRCGVDAADARVYEFPVRRSASTYPAPEGPRVEVRLELPDGLSFVERVGFRYCLDKTLRASAAAVYWRTVGGIHRQRLWMSERLTELHAERPELSFSRARELAGGGLHAREAVVFPHYSLLKGHDRFDRLPRPADRKFQPLHRESCGFPAPVEMLREIGARDWFAPLRPRAETPSEKRYCVEKDATSFPTLALKVLERRSVGTRPVFDLSVEGQHSFVAGTVGVHNCIGNSGPLPEVVSKEIADGGLVVSAVLSGNRNFEGRVHPEVRANYLASPPLVVAYALAGRVDIDWSTEPVGQGADGKPVMLQDIWPSHAEVAEVIATSVKRESFQRIYAAVYEGDPRWQALQVPTGDLYAWAPGSTYIANPPYFRTMGVQPPALYEIEGARVLALLGDSITTDHISPAGNIKKDGPAGRYLLEHGVEQKDFNQYGARRGHHEVMMRGTFANVRLRNLLIPPRDDGSRVEGGFTRFLPGGEVVSIYDAAMAYQKERVPLIVIGGKEYGSGSSRDWAAKGTNLLGVKAVIAESFERIHRSNLVGMGVVPLQFIVPPQLIAERARAQRLRDAGTPAPDPSIAEFLELTGEEVYDIAGLVAGLDKNFDKDFRELLVTATKPDGTATTFKVLCRIDTPQEVQYYKNGGILPFVLRQLLKAE
jgi:aconitase A